MRRLTLACVCVGVLCGGCVTGRDWRASPSEPIAEGEHLTFLQADSVAAGGSSGFATTRDLSALQRELRAVRSRTEIMQAAGVSGGLGLCVASLYGLDNAGKDDKYRKPWLTMAAAGGLLAVLSLISTF